MWILQCRVEDYMFKHRHRDNGMDHFVSRILIFSFQPFSLSEQFLRAERGNNYPSRQKNRCITLFEFRIPKTLFSGCSIVSRVWRRTGIRDYLCRNSPRRSICRKPHPCRFSSFNHREMNTLRQPMTAAFSAWQMNRNSFAR